MDEMVKNYPMWEEPTAQTLHIASSCFGQSNWTKILICIFKQNDKEAPNLMNLLYLVLVKILINIDIAISKGIGIWNHNPPKMFTVTSPWMFLMFFLVKSFPTNSFASTFTLTNNCPQTIWPGTLAGSGTLQLSTTGFKLDSGQSVKIPAFPGWSGRIWARTGCKFDESGVGTCQTGDCGGRLECDGVGAAPPASLFEITMGTNADEKDFYDVSIVDGYNLPLIAAPQEVFGVCNATGCVSDLNTGCPKELQVVDGDNGGVGVVGCKSACEAFGLDQYCCSGEFANPTTCRPSSYSTIFKTACPRAYSYAFDDGTSTFTCKASDYAIIFCPNLASGKKRSNSAIPIPAPPMVQFQHTINREISDMITECVKGRFGLYAKEGGLGCALERAAWIVRQRGRLGWCAKGGGFGCARGGSLDCASEGAAWVLWVYAYFPRLAPVPFTETPLVVPFLRRFDGRCTRRPRETFSFFRRFFDTITPAEITWQPWAPLPAAMRDRFACAEETSRFRILLEGPVCWAWYLGEHFLRQTLGLPE
ncbi:hypothetical protein TEA_012935 [Camellia sinensis var. sinensis]|uniref:Thaumatin-like protein n=1 Tax=Camellia sinensis var. sinensis TaxID=542762 RepID=A0A4S4DQ00_CAMSN|nr:hypothetical protein TEA_012935 [Camellia sinensis var. sinensis]